MADLIPVARVAALLSLSRKRVYQLIAAGKIDCLRTSPRSMRVTRASVDKFIKEQLERERRKLGLDLKPTGRRNFERPPTR